MEINPVTQPQEIPAKQKTFTPKFIALIVLLSVIGLGAAAGIWYWQTSQIPQSVQAPIHKVKVDPTADWKTYTNTQYGFEFKYPPSLELASTNELGGFVPFDPLITSNAFIIKHDSKEVIFSSEVRGNEPLTPTWVTMQPDALKPAILRPPPVAVVVAGMSGYEIAKGTIATTTDFPQGSTYASNYYFLQKMGGPIFQLIVTGDLGNQILSTFKFTAVSAGIINSFTACADAGNPIMESFPEQCRTPDGITFIKQNQPCIQVITPAKNPKTGEVRDFPTPCDVPTGWEKVSGSPQ